MLKAPKIIEFIKKHGVKISPIEPTTSEAIWFKKGKNLYSGGLVNETISAEGVISYSSNRLRTVKYIPVHSSSTYTISCATTDFRTYVFEYDANKNFIRRIGTSWNNMPYTCTLGSTTKYILVIFEKFGDNITPMSVSDLQIEQNSTATTYEPYVEKEILVKNNNGVYEKFYNENDVKKEIYSSTEQKIGIWIDGKTLYRKVLSKTVTTTGASNIPHGIGDIDKVTKFSGYIELPGGVFVPIPQQTSNGSIGNIQMWTSRANISFNNNVSLSNYTVYFIFEYTKTTD